MMFRKEICFVRQNINQVREKWGRKSSEDWRSSAKCWSCRPLKAESRKEMSRKTRVLTAQGKTHVQNKHSIFGAAI